MLMKQIIDAYEVLDSTYVTGEKVKEYLLGIKPDANIEVYELVGPKGSTDMLKVRIPGKRKNERWRRTNHWTFGTPWRNRRPSGTDRLCIRRRRGSLCRSPCCKASGYAE